jgi:hypothetical protein
LLDRVAIRVEAAPDAFFDVVQPFVTTPCR